MSIKIDVKKTVIVLCLILFAAASGYWFVTTKDERAKKAQYKQLVDFAERQAVEIAIIEQASKLKGYKQHLAKLERANTQSVMESVKPSPPAVKVLEK